MAFDSVGIGCLAEEPRKPGKANRRVEELRMRSYALRFKIDASTLPIHHPSRLTCSVPERLQGLAIEEVLFVRESVATWAQVLDGDVGNCVVHRRVVLDSGGIAGRLLKRTAVRIYAARHTSAEYSLYEQGASARVGQHGRRLSVRDLI